MGHSLLYGSESPCCRSRSLIVQSRDGGFITQNCMACGKARPIAFSELPSLICKSCGKPLEPFKDHYGTYSYRCRICGTEFKFADVVPHWSEHFDYDGFALKNQ